ncbi:MAG TPA: GtrA family protein [Roseiflexaceae bacterium]|nr:GtrA family protein [Roseiflexaceae bacterium]
MAASAESLRATTPLRLIGRFLTVGALGTCVDMMLFVSLRSGLGLSVLLANVVAYCAGMLNNYLLHRRWTYREIAHKVVGVQALQFAAVSLSALALNTTLVLLLTPVFGGLFSAPTAADLLAKLVATAAGVGWNFFANHFWTFRSA